MKEKKPTPQSSLLHRAQKTLHIPNPVKPPQVRADIGFVVLERDELVVGIAAAPFKV